MTYVRGTILALALMVCAKVAHADWGVYAAAYSCDSARQRFAIMSDIDSSNGSVGSYRSEDERFVERLSGGVHSLTCKIGSHLVRATVIVNDPNTHMCQGAGHSSLKDVVIDGKSIALPGAPSIGPKYPLDGTYACSGEPGPATIKVVFEPELISICLSPLGDWKADEQNVRCHVVPMRANKLLERTRER
jgi:hypothetical protein